MGEGVAQRESMCLARARSWPQSPVPPLKITVISEPDPPSKRSRREQTSCLSPAGRSFPLGAVPFTGRETHAALPTLIFAFITGKSRQKTGGRSDRAGWVRAAGAGSQRPWLSASVSAVSLRVHFVV